MASDDIFLQALQGKNNHGRPPVWLMRQAGRYMPSYQKLRKNWSLDAMFTTPELMVEITCMPVDQLGVDAAIVFSDILLILKTMGLGVRYLDQGLEIDTFENLEDPRIGQYGLDIEESFSSLDQAIRLLRGTLAVPLIGFTAAPFTLACYGLDGARAALGVKTKQLMWLQRGLFRNFLHNIGERLYRLARLQVKAGAQVLQLFDSHTHMLSREEFQHFVLPSLYPWIEKINQLGVPVIYFTRATAVFADLLETLPSCALGLDWQSDLEWMRSQSSKVLQGNFNPWALLQEPSQWSASFQQMLHDRRGDCAYICGLGHGVLPQTPWSHVRELVDRVHHFRE